MRDPAPAAVQLRDYRPPAFLIGSVELDFDIGEDSTRVRARLEVARNRAAAEPDSPLVLDAEDLEFESAALEGRTLATGDFTLDASRLTIPRVPARFVLETACRIRPHANTKLTGLYAARAGLFTQCEAEGFRRITY